MDKALEPLDEHNKILEANVHPPTWTNPTPKGKYNLVVVGAGTAGLVTAAGAAGLGAKVALIERALMGGDCLNVGCVPSKAIIASGRVAATIAGSGPFGIQSQRPEVDFPAVMERMRKLRSGISHHDSAKRFTDLGIDVFIGDGKFTGPDTVEVKGQTLQFSKGVVATGARAAAIPIPGLAEAGHLNNETLFSLTSLPKRMAVLGGGPIGCEMAQTFARMGCKVTLIERAETVLAREDQQAAKIVQASMEKDGVRILNNCKIQRVTSANGQKSVHVSQEGKNIQVDVSEILLAIGRAPNVNGLGLEIAGVDYDEVMGVQVNDRLQTTNPKIFAAGDICSPFKFTHAADFMARIVIQNSLFMGRAKVSDLVIPWATYTSPELAQVGITEQDAAGQGMDVDVYTQPFSGVDRAILESEDEGFVKVIVGKGTDKILGATVVATNAGDMIGELTLAMKNNIGLKKIGSTIHPYPTQGEAIRKLGDQFNRTRLKPWVKSLFQWWLKRSR